MVLGRSLGKLAQIFDELQFHVPLRLHFEEPSWKKTLMTFKRSALKRDRISLENRKMNGRALEHPVAIGFLLVSLWLANGFIILASYFPFEEISRVSWSFSSGCSSIPCMMSLYFLRYNYIFSTRSSISSFWCFSPLIWFARWISSLRCFIAAISSAWNSKLVSMFSIRWSNDEYADHISRRYIEEHPLTFYCQPFLPAFTTFHLLSSIAPRSHCFECLKRGCATFIGNIAWKCLTLHVEEKGPISDMRTYLGTFRIARMRNN